VEGGRNRGEWNGGVGRRRGGDGRGSSPWSAAEESAADFGLLAGEEEPEE
jgi:hypothetical protein